ncbi:MAG: isopentenyl phosphate kinase family protein [Methanomicrobiales archaeon]|nr:isopentenyl phosphate kinase family protein [Methanomicrobiales archaeon]
MSDTIILKIGGSVLTDKSGDCAIDHQRLAAIAQDIGEAKKQALLLIHGAGSCGHPQAQKHHLDRGLLGGHIGGVYETHAAVCALNETVVGALRAAGVEAIGIHPLGNAVAEEGRLVSFASVPLALMQDQGIVPVLHGDVVMDRIRGATIVSGDQLITYLAATLGMTRVGLATDVPGVLREGRVIRRLSTSDDGISGTGRSSYPDVTGGMQGKIAELLLLAGHGIESHIFHVSRLRDFLEGADHGGTVVEAGK